MLYEYPHAKAPVGNTQRVIFYPTNPVVPVPVVAIAVVDAVPPSGYPDVVEPWLWTRKTRSAWIAFSIRVRLGCSESSSTAIQDVVAVVVVAVGVAGVAVVILEAAAIAVDTIVAAAVLVGIDPKILQQHESLLLPRDASFFARGRMHIHPRQLRPRLRQKPQS